MCLLRKPICTASRSSTSAVAEYRSKNTFIKINLQDGTVTFDVRRKYRRTCSIIQNDEQDTPIDVPKSFELSFAFLPNNHQRPRIAVDIRERLSYEGSFLRKPALSVSAILANDSEVFRLIKDGNLEGLIRSLSLRKVFLTDRDIDGRCLLSVSLCEKYLRFKAYQYFIVSACTI